ncbi:hypothetical protein CEXT_232211, partial [Caerostris extrusa]
MRPVNPKGLGNIKVDVPRNTEYYNR